VILEIKAAKFGEVTRATPFDIVTPFDKVEGVYHQLARRLDRQYQRPTRSSRNSASSTKALMAIPASRCTRTRRATSTDQHSSSTSTAKHRVPVTLGFAEIAYIQLTL
jgi:hypothetical protein